ncbi:hypothetical protein BJ742DRAFT_679046 [Cladochytrium replicatum]|nr:hypothetical protein BJ742DRAFT_679046 [Cladochytrium replicatum]
MPLPNLQSQLKLGSLTLKNRYLSQKTVIHHLLTFVGVLSVVLASLTRDRNSPNRVPEEINAQYYAQRAGAGLIMTEATLISEQGVEWETAPGIFTKEQIEGWSRVASAVHEKGSLIFMQLWHIGRVAHPGMDANGSPTLSPSGIAAKGGKFRLLPGSPGYIQNPEVIEDPWKIIDLFRQGARNAMEAGCDGVEIHSANGYLPHQFLESHSNTRTDEWGGSPENRAKFTIEAVKAAIRGVGGDAKRVGIKLSPCGGSQDMGDPKDTLIREYSYLITELDKLNIGYIQLARYFSLMDTSARGTPLDLVKAFRPLIKNSLVMFNGGFTGTEAEEFVKSGKADLISFGLPFIRTPDLPERLFKGKPLDNALDMTMLYGGKDVPRSRGYTDFPAYEEWSKTLSTGQRVMNSVVPVIVLLLKNVMLYRNVFALWVRSTFYGDVKLKQN